MKVSEIDGALKKLSKIEGSLSYGVFRIQERIAGGFIGAFVFVVGVVYFMLAEFETAFKIIMSICGVFCFTVCFVSAIKSYKLMEKVLVWLEDAVEVKAYSKMIDTYPALGAPTKIKVDFTIEGKKYSRISEGKMPGIAVPEGYHKVWSSYANKEIDILYSTKHDQVFILKKLKIC